MFCSKKALHRLNNIHERPLVILQGCISQFIAPLFNTNEKSIHQTCLEFLMIEIYKCLNGLSFQIMSDIFKLRKNIHNLKYFHIFES